MARKHNMYSYLSHQSELYTDVLMLSAVGCLQSPWVQYIYCNSDQSSCTSNRHLRVQSELSVSLLECHMVTCLYPRSWATLHPLTLSVSKQFLTILLSYSLNK